MVNINNDKSSQPYKKKKEKSPYKIQDPFKSLPASYQADIRWQHSPPRAINEKVCYSKQRHKPLHISPNSFLENAARSNPVT